MQRIINKPNISRSCARSFHSTVAPQKALRRYTPQFYYFDDPWDDLWFNQSEPQPNSRPQKWKPMMDVKESNSNYILTTELAGVSPDDINIDVSKDHLTISGEKKEEKTDKKDNYSITERSFGKFFRKFPLSSRVDIENIKADLDNGILKITVPKITNEQYSKVKINVNEPKRLEKE